MIRRRKKQQPEEYEEEYSSVPVLGSDIEGQLTIDVYQTEEEIIVESTIAGVDPDNIDIDVTSDSVTIRGERHKNTEIAETDYFYQECFWGRFSRSVILPQEVDPDKAYSNLKNGVLTVHLPKINKDRARKISVKRS
ncbi:MAG: Hsp20/alpha crystallin family protein [bacterium]|nr:Hsp20/alpha crystallin family protein [bacterium]